MWLTFATFVGYAVDLHRDPEAADAAEHRDRRRLGRDAAGARLGRDDAATSAPEALILFLIIFLWTPPHFWALALYRAEDYRKAGLPMLPVTHGNEFTRLQVLLYTLVLFAATLLPFVYGMSGLIYLAAAVVLGAVFMRLRAGGSGATTPTRWRARPSASRSSTCRCCSRRCWSTTTCGRSSCDSDAPRASRCALAGAALLAGCDRLAGKRAAPTFHFDRHHRRRVRAASSQLTDARRQAAHARRLQGQGRGACSSATRSAPTSARRRWPSWRRSRSSSAPTATSCRCVFVTIDPERDTPEMLKAYVANFDPGFVALRGNAEQTRSRGQGVQGLLPEGRRARRAGSYTMDHSRRLLRLRPAGPPAPVRRYGGDAEALAADIKQLLAERLNENGPAEPALPCRETSAAERRSEVRASARLPRSALRIFFIAATSIWRMRSALTPYSPARSCSVMPPELSSLTLSQRSSTMRRLRASSASSASGDAVAGQPVALLRFDHARRLAARRRPGRRSARSSPRRRRSAARARRRRPTGAFPSRALPRA